MFTWLVYVLRRAILRDGTIWDSTQRRSQGHSNQRLDTFDKMFKSVFSTKVFDLQETFLSLHYMRNRMDDIHWKTSKLTYNFENTWKSVRKCIQVLMYVQKISLNWFWITRKPLTHCHSYNPRPQFTVPWVKPRNALAVFADFLVGEMQHNLRGR